MRSKYTTAGDGIGTEVWSRARGSGRGQITRHRVRSEERGSAYGIREEGEPISWRPEAAAHCSA